jgi:hypothetical protein
MAKAPTTVYGEVRPAIRAMIDQGYTDEVIAQTLRKRLSHVQSERYDYQRVLGKPMLSEPSMPAVSILAHDVDPADFQIGLRALEEAGL